MMRLHEAIFNQYEVALARKNGGEEKSYTCYLYNAGTDKILKKCGEETFEAVVAAKEDDTAETVGEINDVLYHVTVLLCHHGVTMDAVLRELNVRCAAEGKELDELFSIIAQRSTDRTEGSYTGYLFEQGLNKILKKVGEAVSLFVIAAKNGDTDKTAFETADLIYHLFAMMICKGITLDELADELDKRSGKTGNLKQFHSTNVNS